MMIVLTISLSSNLSVEANEKKPEVTPNELIEFGVEPNKAQSLAKKINNGQKTDSQIFREKNGKQINHAENYYKEFDDGSFIKNSVESVKTVKSENQETDPYAISPLGVDLEEANYPVEYLRVKSSFFSSIIASMSYSIEVVHHYNHGGSPRISKGPYNITYNGGINGISDIRVVRNRPTSNRPGYAYVTGNSWAGSFTLNYYLYANGEHGSST